MHFFLKSVLNILNISNLKGNIIFYDEKILKISK